MEGQAQDQPQRGDVRLAMLAIDAGGEEARRALPNASSLIAARVPMRISAAPQPVGFDPDALRDVPFLWIHGRTDFQLDAVQRKVLRDYVENGGIILGLGRLWQSGLCRRISPRDRDGPAGGPIASGPRRSSGIGPNQWV